MGSRETGGSESRIRQVMLLVQGLYEEAEQREIPMANVVVGLLPTRKPAPPVTWYFRDVVR